MAESFAFRAVTFGSRGYKLRRGELAFVIERLGNGTVIGCIAKGLGRAHKKHYSKIWPSWKPARPNKVYVNRVKFVTIPKRIPPEIHGIRSQIGIPNTHTVQCLNHLYSA